MVFCLFSSLCWHFPDVSRKVTFEYLEISHSSVTSHDSDVIQRCTRIMTLWDCKLYMVKYCKCTAQHCVFTSSIQSAVIIFWVSVFSLFCYIKSLMEDSLSEGLAAFLPFKIPSGMSCMIKSPALCVCFVCFWVGGGVFKQYFGHKYCFTSSQCHRGWHSLHDTFNFLFCGGSLDVKWT